MFPIDNQQTKLKLLSLDFLEVFYSYRHQWLETHWHGILDAGKARTGCLTILECLAQQPASKILNYNNMVTGHYPGAIEWVADVWFPRLYEEGVRRFAWIYSSEFYTQVGTDGIIGLQKEIEVEAFYDALEAQEWLLAKSS